MKFACAIFLFLGLLVSAMDGRTRGAQGMKGPLKAAACNPTDGKTGLKQGFNLMVRS